MVRPKKRSITTSTAAKPELRRPTTAERSAYFARREAAKVLRAVLNGDSNRRAVGSIKSLVYSPSIRNKKGTFALVCQTLKHLPIIKDILDSASILNGKWKRQGELMYIITYDILFGQAASLVGDAEKFLLLRKDALQSGLAQHLVRKGVKNIKDLMALQQISDISKPRYVRVNTLKFDLESALHELGKQNTLISAKYVVHKDDMVPDLLLLPHAVDLHNHPLVRNGSVFMQGKASSMTAVALQPEPGWEVLDACAAPGNKTVHLAALMRGKGKIIACELNQERIQRLNDTVKLAGAVNVDVLHEDFLNLNPKDPSYSKVRAILLDPSCSGSGTAAVRLDHLLPSHGAGNADVANIDRLRKLQAFQKKALAHALSFPAVERVVYSTCSIHQIENEDVIKAILPLAKSLGFQLATPFPKWPRRGLPVLEGSEHLLRFDPDEDKEGFFISLFVRKSIIGNDAEMPVRPGRRRITSEALCAEKCCCREKKPTNKYGFAMFLPSPFIKMSKIWLHPPLRVQKKDRCNQIQ
ncbi:probable 28S rRNA (cytosine-C(5))-methyltransferase isoform X1 [Camellia sinensis]|uniref:probable 28S rRNA (cytosine-C(5))-methyltransferase isoform X1 n=1 Tax=Camellia sinensis TaxID=4442 RepID=UPI0010363A11|nr:probable 28S rRNA (cytosine-C(5))-methyltransferase isoform X1 [Camellia sinensis]